MIRSVGNKKIHEATSSSAPTHFNSNHAKQRKQTQYWLNVHVLRMIEMALLPSLMDHLTGELLPRMLWADASDTHAAV